MNARMRRIDLSCKLLGPLVIALVAAASVPGAVYATLGMNLVSVLFEYIFIEKVRSRPLVLSVVSTEHLFSCMLNA